MEADDSAAPAALRAQIQRYYGGESRVVGSSRAASGDTFLVVVDTMQRGHLVRILATIGRGGGSLMEQSAMDLARPERLVFFYERAMLVSLALAAAPKTVLLLGLGGGAMGRHLAAFLPAAAVTIVERDTGVIALARRHFRFERAVIEADALTAMAAGLGRFDAVLVDLYDAGGAMQFPDRFWPDCRAALAPGGVIAINWAGTLRGGLPRASIQQALASLPGSFLLIERGPRPNMVQIVPTEPKYRLPMLAQRLRDFAARHRLPREDRDVLKRCEVTRRYPAGRGTDKL